MISVIYLFAFIYACMFMDLNTLMLKTRSDIGSRMCFTYQEIIMTALCIFVLVFCLHIYAGNVFKMVKVSEVGSLAIAN